MAISRDYIDELHERSDITDVVGSYVSLKRRGRVYTGLCPFHNEKTPSFTVYPDNGSFYCFGCGAGGDVITFIELRENLDYVGAVQLLASRAGMALPEDKDDRAAATRKRIYELNKLSARFFFDSLNSDGGRAARGYLRQKRGLDDATIKRFGIGYARNDWDSLRDYLRAKGYRDDELIEAGLCARSAKGSVYDFFMDRVMFPVIDVRGNVVAFSGRTLGSDPRKYVNTRDTAVFKKSRTLYALNIAKSTDTRRIIVAEGQMDVIALHSAGFTNAVAALGTALTDEHARMISQYADEVVLVYDSDEAGAKATRRAIETFKNTNLAIRVVNVPDAKDPDEYIKKNGADRFAELMAKSANSTEYELMRAKQRRDVATDEGKIRYLADAAAVLARVQSPTERDLYAGRVADDTGVNKQAILLQIEQNRKRAYKMREKESDAALPRSVGEKYGVRGMGGAKLAAAASERRLVAMLFANPDWRGRICERVTAEDFISQETAALFTALADAIAADEFDGIASMSSRLDSKQMSLLSGVVAETNGINFPPEDADYIIDKILEPKLEPSSDEIKSAEAEELKKLIEKKRGTER